MDGSVLRVRVGVDLDGGSCAGAARVSELEVPLIMAMEAQQQRAQGYWCRNRVRIVRG